MHCMLLSKFGLDFSACGDMVCCIRCKPLLTRCAWLWNHLEAPCSKSLKISKTLKKNSHGVISYPAPINKTSVVWGGSRVWLSCTNPPTRFGVHSLLFLCSIQNFVTRCPSKIPSPKSKIQDPQNPKSPKSKIQNPQIPKSKLWT